MGVVARFQCHTIKAFENAEGIAQSKEVSFSAVYSADPESPNKQFTDSTPNATLTMLITNPNAYGWFRVGKQYDLTFEEYTGSR